MDHRPDIHRSHTYDGPVSCLFQRRIVDISLTWKAALAPALALFMMTALAFGLMTSIGAQTTALQTVVKRDMASSLAFQRIAQRLAEDHAEFHAVLTDSTAGLDRAGATVRLDGLTRELARLQADLAGVGVTMGLAGTPRFGELETRLHDYRDATVSVGALLQTDPGAAVHAIGPVQKDYRQLSDALAIEVSGASNAAVDRAAAAQAANVRANTFAFVGTISALISVSGLSAMLIVAHRRELAAIAVATLRVARGDLTVDLAPLHRHDELGAIVCGLQVMLDLSHANDRLEVAETASSFADIARRRGVYRIRSAITGD